MTGSSPSENSRGIEGNTSLISVVVLRVKAELQSGDASKSVQFKYKVEPYFERSGECFSCQYEYEVQVEDSTQVRVADFAATFRINLETNLGYKLKMVEVEEFGRRSGLQIVHPYALEMFRSLSSRMGLPPVILDVKIPDI
jgi:hypothetical protein